MIAPLSQALPRARPCIGLASRTAVIALLLVAEKFLLSFLVDTCSAQAAGGFGTAALKSAAVAA